MKVFTLAVVLPDPLSHPLKAARARSEVKRLAGLAGAVPAYPAAILAFATVGHAEKARDALAGIGAACGRYVMEAELSGDRRSLKIGPPACGWDGVDPEDLVKSPDGRRGVAERIPVGRGEKRIRPGDGEPR